MSAVAIGQDALIALLEGCTPEERREIIEGALRRVGDRSSWLAAGRCECCKHAIAAVTNGPVARQIYCEARRPVSLRREGVARPTDWPPGDSGCPRFEAKVDA